MAKLLSYYRLCPLIDTKNLLGISNDCEKGVVLVTLGRNLVIKYKLSDQKQITSWRTRDKLTSQVLYDKEQNKYVAVFNKTFIRLWTDDDENLDKVKKIKFNQQIYNIIMHNEKAVIVFIDGSLYPLSEALENRKTLQTEKIIDDEHIHDILYTSVDTKLYFGFLVKKNNINIFYWCIYTGDIRNIYHKVTVQREQLSLTGYGLHVDRDQVNLLSVWNDGRMYSQILKQDDKDINEPGQLFTVIENISTTNLVKIVDIDDNYIAIYGADPNEEGAILLIYNTQFKVNQSKQTHKLYTNDSKIWRIDNNILLPVGQNLVVVPFCLESEQLAALVGSHKPVSSKPDADVVFVCEFEEARWEDNQNSVNTKERNLSKKLKNKVQEYFKQGLPEGLIVEYILPDILAEQSINLLGESLDFFTDIPEKYLAKILNFILSCDMKKFPSTPEKLLPNLANELLPWSRINLLDRILIREYSDVLLIPYMRCDLDLEQALKLLTYLNYMLSEEGHDLQNLDSLETEKCITGWMSVLIDSNYQKFILSKDRNIENVLIRCKETVMDHLDVLDELKQISPALCQFHQEMQGKNNNAGFSNNLYTVEQLNLY
ncbi:hypothetical protein GWI33_017985 [Rhynchophorus ferrugineus]|uniref:Nucleolar protein 11 n=1 Tax=Rhynchophorus ferrugineus TaxID=354439 RepID=A0A834HYQ2_RHYFE|nr:hypothetical protein GWI33_017985 [Rhynchophorus ferrugineus]